MASELGHWGTIIQNSTVGIAAILLIYSLGKLIIEGTFDYLKTQNEALCKIAEHLDEIRRDMSWLKSSKR